MKLILIIKFGEIVNMGKKLAILGHSTRGKEVIELLEMMGGSNIHNLSGNDIYSYYIIKGIKNEIRDELHIFANENIYHFTLEKFLEKYPFKIGDKVIDEADGCPGVVSEMKWDEGLSDMKYCVAFGNGIDFGWYANNSINFFKIKKNENLEETQSKRDIDKSEFMIKHMILPNKVDDKLEYEIIDGYELDKVENNKIILKPIKSKYPTSYEECCEIIHSDPNFYIDTHLYSGTLDTLYKLLICRTAYWKIAGEELELGKPWEPKFGKTILFSIKFYLYQDSFVLHKGEYSSSDNCILVFPTEEMRDAFYENFKDLIEQCKELL